MTSNCCGASAKSLMQSHIKEKQMKWSPSIPDTLGPERTVLNIEVFLFQGLKMYMYISTCMLSSHTLLFVRKFNEYSRSRTYSGNSL